MLWPFGAASHFSRTGRPRHAVGPENQVLSDRQRAEDVPAFGDEAAAAFDDALRRVVVDLAFVELDLAAAGLQNARDGLEQGGLARPVGPDDGDDLARRDVQRDPLEDPQFPIAGFEVEDLKHGRPPGTRG